MQVLRKNFRPATRWRVHGSRANGEGGRVVARCSLCEGELLCGERGWYHNGLIVCEDCFPAFARAELAEFEVVFGECR